MGPNDPGDEGVSSFDTSDVYGPWRRLRSTVLRGSARARAAGDGDGRCPPEATSGLCGVASRLGRLEPLGGEARRRRTPEPGPERPRGAAEVARLLLRVVRARPRRRGRSRLAHLPALDHVAGDERVQVRRRRGAAELAAVIRLGALARSGRVRAPEAEGATGRAVAGAKRGGSQRRRGRKRRPRGHARRVWA